MVNARAETYLTDFFAPRFFALGGQRTHFLAGNNTDPKMN
jgi:hypothetical protein